MRVNEDIRNGLSFKIDRLDNRKNEKMNDVLSIDYAVRDWVDDTDLIMSRYSQEFPRLSSGMHKRSFKNLNNPWGDKR